MQANSYAAEIWSISEHERIEEFLLYLCVCHELIAERKPDGSIIYNACSPDDLCLVEFAKSKGYEFLGTDEHGILSIAKKSN